MDEDSSIFTVGILTVSDAGSRGERADTSGDAVRDIMESEGFAMTLRDILPDEADLVADKLREWCDGGEVDRS